MIPGGRRNSPSTLPAPARAVKILLQGRKPLWMHMAHMGVIRIECNINGWSTPCTPSGHVAEVASPLPPNACNVVRSYSMQLPVLGSTPPIILPHV